ncbi:hypothetical protein, partial [Neisseria mucosa]|uniref:hypothetical protein n=1 Tax=Neisseria mucosa TaxID=488 RepID=UPI001878456A
AGEDTPSRTTSCALIIGINSFKSFAVRAQESCDLAGAEQADIPYRRLAHFSVHLQHSPQYRRCVGIVD